MRIAVVYSLPTKRALASPFLATDEDTRDSALEVQAALKAKGARPFLVPVSEHAIDTISAISADAVFNLIEWTGVDLPLSLEAISRIEALGIPYTGASRENFEKTSDKIKMKEALDVIGIPTPRWQLFTKGDEPPRADFRFPVIMKLAWEHCSVGLTRDAVVEKPQSLNALAHERIRVFGQPVYAEEFISGRELQVTILEKAGKPVVLPAAEIVFRGGNADNFLTFEGRWNEKHADFKASKVIRATLPEMLERELLQLSEHIFTAIGFCDYARWDIRLRGKEIFVLETNSNPGLGDSDEYGMTVSYKAAGMTFDDFIWGIIVSCCRRYSKKILLK